jgi:tripartite-type tricarboxylate transporter receptor subunit TctC
VSLPAGGVTDTTARLFADAVAHDFGQPVIVENKPGGNGIVAVKALMRAPSDGYTVLVTASGTHTILPSIQDMPFDAHNDLEPITMLITTPLFLCVPAESPASSVSDLVAYARTKTDGLNFGTLAPGSTPYLAGRFFKDSSHVQMAFIHYKGTSELLTDLITSRVDFSFSTYSSVKAFHQTKKVKLLAIDSDRRWQGLPDVPTMAEAGFPIATNTSWFALIAPKNTPVEIVRTLNAEFIKASRSPDLVRRAEQDGFQISTSTPEELSARMIADTNKLAPLLKAVAR